MDNRLKGLVDSVVSLAKSIGESCGIAGYEKEVLQDVARYMMYLSASDGVISPDEVLTISGYVGIDLTPEQVGDFLRDNKIYSSEFEHKVPESLKKLVEVDNALRESDAPQKEDASEILLELYKNIGEELIGADGDVHISEETDMYIYLTTLDKYLTDHLTSRKEKNSHEAQTVKAPEKK